MKFLIWIYMNQIFAFSNSKCINYLDKRWHKYLYEIESARIAQYISSIKWQMYCEFLSQMICRLYESEFSRVPKFVNAHMFDNSENKKENATVEIRFGTPPIFWLPCQRAGLVPHSACSPARNAIHSTFNVSAPSRFIERCVAGSTPRVRAVKFVALVVLSCGIKGASQKDRPIATNSTFGPLCLERNCELLNLIDKIVIAQKLLVFTEHDRKMQY